MRREKRSTLDSAVRTIWIVIVIVTGIPALVPSCTPQRAFGATTDDGDARLAESGAAAVDRLRTRFRETLTLAPLYDEFFTADAARRCAEEGAFCRVLSDFGVSRELVDRLDDAALRRAFVAYFDLTHLAAAYTLASATRIGKDDASVPPVVRQRAEGTTYVRGVLFEEKSDAPAVTTPEEFADLVAELQATCDDYRRVVSSATFDAPQRAENLRALGDESDDVDVTVADASSGYTRFGAPEGERLVEVLRDRVFWYAVRFVDGRPRLLTAEIGDD